MKNKSYFSFKLGNECFNHVYDNEQEQDRFAIDLASQLFFRTLENMEDVKKIINKGESFDSISMDEIIKDKEKRSFIGQEAEALAINPIANGANLYDHLLDKNNKTNAEQQKRFRKFLSDWNITNFYYFDLDNCVLTNIVTKKVLLSRY